jgi:hypothetical protein
LGSKKTFISFNNPLETIKEFDWPKKANNGKTYFSRRKKIFKKAGSIKIRPFLRPISAFWPKTDHFKPIQPIWSKNAISLACFGCK